MEYTLACNNVGASDNTSQYHSGDSFVAFKNEVMVLDNSGSMDSPGFESGRTKKEILYSAGMRFLDNKYECHPETHLCIILFTREAHVLCPFLHVGKNCHRLRQAFLEMMAMPTGGTRMGAGLEAAIRSLRHKTDFIQWHILRNIPYTRIIALTDGQDEQPKRALRAASVLKKQGVLVETIGIEKDRASVNESFLRAVATTDTNGFNHYKFLGDAESIYMTFEQLGQGVLTYEG